MSYSEPPPSCYRVPEQDLHPGGKAKESRGQTFAQRERLHDNAVDPMAGVLRVSFGVGGVVWEKVSDSLEPKAMHIHWRKPPDP